MIVVTGGSGFIGSNFIIDWLNRFNEETSSNLPLFESGYLDTDNSIFVGGQFLEQKKERFAEEN